jgi:hypothetical protein
MKIKSIVMALLVPFFMASCMPAAQVAPMETTVTLLAMPTSAWDTYTSQSFLITLQYPSYWEPDEGDEGFSGKDGFFRISASSIAGLTAKEWCELEIQHNPDKTGIYRYGENPTMEVLKVDNRPACLVLPESERGSSLLVVEYPQLEGGQTRLLFFDADKVHIRDLVDTLQFVRYTH